MLANLTAIVMRIATRRSTANDSARASTTGLVDRSLTLVLNGRH